MRLTFFLNGKEITIDAPSGQLLADIICTVDDKSDTTDTYIAASGCREGKCGRCLVLIDGEVRHSCLTPGFNIRNRHIVTFSGFKAEKEYETITKGFEQAGYAPCRICRAGRVLVTKALLDKYTMPTDDQICEGFATVTCHCSGYLPFYQAVKTAARLRRQL